MVKHLILSAIALWFVPFISCVQAQKAIPQPTEFLVNDFAGLLGREEVVALGQKLSDFAKQSSTQIVVITEKSLEGEDAFDYSQRLAQAWGIGGQQNDNGILLYIAKEDRQVRIQTGYGSEGFLPDAIARRIIETYIVPAFRQENYYQGIDQATNAIIELAKGEYTADNKKESEGTGIPLIFIILLFIVVFFILSNMGRGGRYHNEDGGYYRGGRYDMDSPKRRGGGWIILPGPGGWTTRGGGNSDNSGGWGGFGGGDFGGFGGGDFGGGGAGGEW